MLCVPMDLDAFLTSRGHGAAADLARQLGVSEALVSFWRAGRQVPAGRAIEIERATGGAVRVEELRPDIDWAVLREP